MGFLKFISRQLNFCIWITKIQTQEKKNCDNYLITYFLKLFRTDVAVRASVVEMVSFIGQIVRARFKKQKKKKKKKKLLCRLGLYNTPTASLLWGKNPPSSERPGYNTQQIWWWGSSNAGTFLDAKYPFIAIAPRSTLAQRGSTW